MYTVSQLPGVSKHNGRGLIIYLSNAADRASDSWQTFERLLGDLGRDLRASGAVVIAFRGQDDAVASDLLTKPWGDRERVAISRRPGLIVIDRNFDDFDPRVHSYMHIDLSTLYNQNGTLNEKLALHLITGLNRAFLGNEELFHSLNDMKILLRRKQVREAVKLGPSFYGFGIDIGQFLRALKS